MKNKSLLQKLFFNLFHDKYRIEANRIEIDETFKNKAFVKTTT